MGRLNKDVFSNNATVATLSAGMNDVNRGLYSQIKVPDDAENSKRKAIDGFKQNVVKISDFRSNDAIQIDIQKKFASINLPGTTKNVTYLRKRTDEVGKRTNEIIKKELF